MARPNSRNIKELQEKLLNWYQLNGRMFPWRGRSMSEFEIIVTETLLQRTKAETVSKFYELFFKKHKDWKSLSATNLRSLQSLLKPIGLYRQRARRLKQLSLEMVGRGGVVPKSKEELEKIPFFGQYIINAVQLLIFGLPSPLLDINMARVLERYFHPRTMADIRYDPYLQKLAHQIATHTRSKELNWAILDFASLVCTSQRPKCELCILKKKCTFFTYVKSM